MAQEIHKGHISKNGYIKEASAKLASKNVKKVAERHFFEFSRVLPLANAPGRQNPQGMKTFRLQVVTFPSNTPQAFS